MWYTTSIITSVHNCSQCQSPLVLVSQKTEKVEGSLFPQTSTIYHCSDQNCQEEKDKQVEKRLKLLRDKELADSIRMENKLKEKKLQDKISTEEHPRV